MKPSSTTTKPPATRNTEGPTLDETVAALLAKATRRECRQCIALGLSGDDNRKAWAHVARIVLMAQCELLAEWPPGRPRDYVPDFSIGECSVLNHCDDVAARVLGKLGVVGGAS